jgi:hypothetical protein
LYGTEERQQITGRKTYARLRNPIFFQFRSVSSFFDLRRRRRVRSAQMRWLIRSSVSGVTKRLQVEKVKISLLCRSLSLSSTVSWIVRPPESSMTGRCVILADSSRSTASDGSAPSATTTICARSAITPISTICDIASTALREFSVKPIESGL